MNEEKDLKPEENETEPQAPVTEEETKPEQPAVETITEEAVEPAAPEEPSTEEGAEQPEALLEESAVSEEAPAGEGAEQPEASVEEPAAVEEPEPAPMVVYRWNYGEQRQYDEQIRRKKEGRRSRLAFFGIVSCAFLVVIGLLIGVLAFRDYFVPKRQSTDTVTIAENLLPSTVLVTATKGTTGATGSGFFVREDGMIVTNYHVVEGMDAIKVKLYGELLKKEATLVGYNAECDIAVLKIQGSGYPAVTFGDSSAMRVGDIAIAIGNPAGSDAQWTVTQGIMSSVDRRLLLTGTAENTEITELRMLQTDAAVNPGNSGGLLCNDAGEVIGIVARKQVYRVLVTGSNETVTVFDEGIGYAIPGNGAKLIFESLIAEWEMSNKKEPIANGKVDPVTAGLMRKRPKIGITVTSIKRGEKLIDEQEINAPQDGVLVSEVSAKGANGLLSPGDIIVQFAGVPVTESEQVIEMLYSYKRGDKVKLRVVKNGDFFSTEIELTLGVFDD